MRPLMIGLSDAQRGAVIAELNVALANEMLLIIKTKKVHWDIVGPQFLTLHKLLDEQYQFLSDAADELAERVRALGGYPLGTAAGYLDQATVKEHPGEVLKATGSIEIILEDHEQIICVLRGMIDRCEDENGDRGTADQLTSLLQQHEEAAWMLRSFIEGEAVRSDGQVKLPDSATPSMA